MADNIGIEIRYEGREGFPADAVVATIERVEAVVREQESRQLETLARDLEDLPSVAVDAARQRLRVHEGESVIFYSASEGSIVLLAAVAGLSAWLLEKTLGETLTDAWLETDLHKKLKRLLLAGSRYKAEGIALGIEKQNTITLSNQKKVELHASMDSDGGSIIYVRARLHAGSLPPLERIGTREEQYEGGGESRPHPPPVPSGSARARGGGGRREQRGEEV
ncbi:MAG: hypothetical protein ACJ76N_24155 [Thermoanaerobaculia bacterium]